MSDGKHHHFVGVNNMMENTSVCLRPLSLWAFRKKSEKVVWTNVIRKDVCVWCGLRRGKKSKLSKEHIVPLAQGGTGDWTNIAGAHGHCNSKRGTRSLLQEMLRRRRLPARPNVNDGSAKVDGSEGRGASA